MDYIPEVLFTDIFLFLSPKELFSQLIKVSKLFQRTITSGHFLDNLLKISSRIELRSRIDPQISLKVLKDIQSNQNFKQLLEFIPVSTDGGADEDKESFWFGHVFEINERSWCTLENIRNAHASAVLADTQTEAKGYFWANKNIVNIVKRWLNSRGQALSRKNEHIASAIFNHVVTTFPLDAIVIDEPDSEALKQKIRESFMNIRPFSGGVKQSRRFCDKIHIHDMKFDKESADESKSFALIKFLDISRKGGFTCPVKTLMVFVSFKFIDILEEDLKVFDDIADYQDLVKLQSIDSRVACPNEKKEFPGVEYCEFSRTRSRLKPVIWLNFTDDNRIDEYRVTLDHFVSGKYYYVKLIRAEDRRQERDWIHDNMNIDVNYILPRGVVLNLNDFS